MITQRQNAILNLIVEMFTRTHEPVGSKALQESIDSSSATIRNDMAKLEKMGYLEKAHTSSGRMPSRAGFQYFVANSLIRLMSRMFIKLSRPSTLRLLNLKTFWTQQQSCWQK